MATPVQEGAEMASENLIGCTIERGGFSSEGAFSIQSASGELIIGGADVRYLRDENRHPLHEGQLAPGQQIHGFVQCRVLNITDGQAVVEVPSADVVTVEKSELS
jgi:hypothetical protein